MRISRAALLLLAAVLATACGDEETRRTTAAKGGSTEQLPAPATAAGGVTGMPDEPGPGPVGPPVAGEPEVPLDAHGNPLLPEGSPESADAVAAEPTPDEAVAVLREYYGAINRGDFAQAYAFWSDGGRSSGQSPQQFAAGFAETTGISVEMQPPGNVGAAAGSRYVEVPVSLVTTQRDGSQRRYVGIYTMRRAAVDGATAEQRAWRIGSADIREVQ